MRCFPEVLPTQASLRWSTKSPNLGGFKREFWRLHRGMIRPDPGEWWLEWDWSGIEGRMFTGYSGDEEDLEWFQPGRDVHTETCRKYLFAWDALPDDWQGSKDDRRTLAKNFRYGVYQYGRGARVVLGMPGIERLGLDRGSLVARAQAFLFARPKGVAFKEATWRECIEQKEARTFMGARRKLFGKPEDRAKDGLNHKIQGSVANLMNWCLIRCMEAFPDASLILNRHDGATVAFPTRYETSVVMDKVRQIVEREWEIGPGVHMRFPATWEVIRG